LKQERFNPHLFMADVSAYIMSTELMAGIGTNH